MLPVVAADPTAPDSGVISAVKRSSSDDDKPHGGQSKTSSPQGHQDTGEHAQAAVVSDKRKKGNIEHHDDINITPHGAKKPKQQDGLGLATIDINKALHDDDDGDGPASPCGGGGGENGGSPSSPRRLSLEIKKRELEIDAETLELERQRVRWAKASRKKDAELEMMRLENGRMKLENERLWVLLRRRERELGVKSKRV